MAPNYYEILGLPADAPPERVVEACDRWLAEHGLAADAPEAREVAEIRATLTDPATRLLYDRALRQRTGQSQPIALPVRPPEDDRRALLAQRLAAAQADRQAARRFTAFLVVMMLAWCLVVAAAVVATLQLLDDRNDAARALGNLAATLLFATIAGAPMPLFLYWTTQLVASLNDEAFRLERRLHELDRTTRPRPRI